MQIPYHVPFLQVDHDDALPRMTIPVSCISDAHLGTFTTIFLGSLEPILTKPHGQGPKDLAAYISQHAGSIIYWQNAGWKDDTYNGKPALSFTTGNGTRFRLLSGEDKYISPKGFKRCWYRLVDAIAFAETAGGPLVLCNGEASVISAQYFGVPAMALAGGTEKGTVPPELLSELKAKWQGSIIVAMDCDLQGRKAGPKLAAFLRDNGFSAHAVDLGLFDKGDLADFVKAHSERSLACLRKLPDVAMPVGALRFLTSDDVDNLPTLQPLPGLSLFDEMGFALLYGEGGSYKTFVALRWAHDVAKHASVLYVDAEGLQPIKRRKAALDQRYGKRDKLHFLDRLSLSNAQHVQAIEDFGKQYSVRLIILDTLNRVYPGKEDTESYGKLIDVISQLQKALGCLILALHHTPRDGKNPRGGTVLEDGTDFGYLQAVNTKGWRGFKSVSLVNKRNRNHECRPDTTYVLVPTDLQDGGEPTLVAMSESEAELHTGKKQEALDAAEQEIVARLRKAGKSLTSTELWHDVVRPDGKRLTDHTGPNLLKSMAQRDILTESPTVPGRATIYDLGPKATAP